MRIRNKWTPKEIQYFKNNYFDGKKEDLLSNLDHSWNSIKIKAFKLNLIRRHNYWTELEVEFLMKNYWDENKEYLMLNLNQHSWCSIQKKAESLGLRRNPNIIAYSINEWYYLLKNQTEEGPDDWGGIWVARTLSNAKTLKKYYEKNHLKSARVFKTALDEILYFNSYRIKTNGIVMLEEIKW